MHAQYEGKEPSATQKQAADHSCFVLVQEEGLLQVSDIMQSFFMKCLEITFVLNKPNSKELKTKNTDILVWFYVIKEHKPHLNFCWFKHMKLH